MDQLTRCTLVAVWACSRKARGLTAAPLSVERLDQRVSLVGNGVGCVLGEYGFLGEGYELRLGGMSLLRSEVFGGLVVACLHKLSVTSQPRPACWPACA